MKKQDSKIAIQRSNENWMATELLICSRNTNVKLWNAASNRLYYAVLQLVFAEMIEHTDFRLGANTDSHRQARDYVKNHCFEISRNFRRLEDLRNQADYEPTPVSQIDFYNEWRIWKSDGLYNECVKNLNSELGRMII